LSVRPEREEDRRSDKANDHPLIDKVARATILRYQAGGMVQQSKSIA